MDPTLLLRATATGDRRAFESLYGEFKDRVYNTALGYLQNPLDAEEITQDVFVEIFRSAANFTGASTVSTWIYRITVNKSLDRLKHAKRKKRYAVVLRLFGGERNELSIDPPHFDHPGVLLEQKENAAILFRAVDQLPDQQKTAFILTMVECLPQQEVAEVMSVSIKAVESLLQRAKTSLRASLASLYDGRRITNQRSSKTKNENATESTTD